MHYVPSPTIRDFMLSDKFGRFVVGPIGSGKSLGMIMEILRRSCEQAPDPQGVRPTRWVVVRNTRQQLLQTVVADMRSAYGPLATFRVSDTTMNLVFDLGDGTRVESEILFIPLEDSDDTRRVLSLNITGAWISEFREVDFNIASAIMGRCGRFPSKARVPPTWFGLFAETNPFAEGSEWFKHLVQNLPNNWGLWRQPSGLSEHAENIENLPNGRGYYEQLCEGTSEEWQNVHVHADWGEDLSGQTVFRRSFSRRRHAIEDLVVQPHRPLVIGLDLGRTPSAVLTQEDAMGRFLVHEEVLGADMGLHQFLGERLRPVLSDSPYASLRVIVCFDPAGMAKSQLREESAYDVLTQHGFLARPAPTNDVAPRLRALEGLFLANRGESPAFLMNEERCPTLLSSLAYEYKYRRKKDGVLEDLPEKKHPWSDVVDALQYAALGARFGLAARAVDAVRRAQSGMRPAVSAAGWT